MATLEDLQAQVDALTAQLATKDDALVALQKQFDDQFAALAAAQQQVSDQDAALVALRAQSDAQAASLADAQLQIATKDAALAALQSDRDAKSASIEAKDAELADARVQLTALSAELQTIPELRAQLDDARGSLTATQESLQSLSDLYRTRLSEGDKAISDARLAASLAEAKAAESLVLVDSANQSAAAAVAKAAGEIDTLKTQNALLQKQFDIAGMQIAVANGKYDVVQQQLRERDVLLETARNSADVAVKAAQAQTQLVQSQLDMARSEIANICQKTFAHRGRGEYIVINAIPADMEFVESRRPWTAQKVATGKYILQVTDRVSAEAVLGDLGYVGSG